MRSLGPGTVTGAVQDVGCTAVTAPLWRRSLIVATPLQVALLVLVVTEARAWAGRPPGDVWHTSFQRSGATEPGPAPVMHVSEAQVLLAEQVRTAVLARTQEILTELGELTAPGGISHLVDFVDAVLSNPGEIRRLGPGFTELASKFGGDPRTVRVLVSKDEPSKQERRRLTIHAGRILGTWTKTLERRTEDLAHLVRIVDDEYLAAVTRARIAKFRALARHLVEYQQYLESGPPLQDVRPRHDSAAPAKDEAAKPAGEAGPQSGAEQEDSCHHRNLDRMGACVAT